MVQPRYGTWATGADAYTPADAARALAWHGPDDPGDWHPVVRTFRDGHAETWWAADATLGWWGPDGFTRLVVATACLAPCRARPPGTWPRTCPAGGPREADSPHPAADLGRDRADLRHPALDRAELQAGQGRPGGRLPGRRIPRSASDQAWSVTRSASLGRWFAENPPQHGLPQPAAWGLARRRGGPQIAVPPPDRPGHGRCARPRRPSLDRAAALVAGMVQAPPPRSCRPMNSVAAGRGLHLDILN